MSHDLVTRFGSVAAVFASERLTLEREFPERAVAIAMLATAYRLMVASRYEQLRRSACLTNGEAVVEYLRLVFSGEKREVIRLLLLDAKLRLIRDEVVGLGSISSATVPVREIIRRSLELGAAALILAHNHPSGDPTPSGEDVALTRRLARLAGELDLRLVDHVIIAGSRWSSMAAEGML